MPSILPLMLAIPLAMSPTGSRARVGLTSKNGQAWRNNSSGVDREGRKRRNKAQKAARRRNR